MDTDFPFVDQGDALDQAAISVARKSLSCSCRSLVTFVSALADSRFGGIVHEAQQWTILDEAVQSKGRTGVRDQNFATIAERSQLLNTSLWAGYNGGYTEPS